MGRNLSQGELLEHKELALKKIEAYIDSLIQHPDGKVRSKADKLSYWLEDWSTFLSFESEFSPSSLRRYKRGEIIKAHLGYNVGSEEGGLHYCVIVDKNNSIYSPVITIIPLTSVKPWTNVEKLKKGCVYLGNELFTNLSSKISLVHKTITAQIGDLQQRIDNIGITDEDEKETLIASIEMDIQKAQSEQTLLFGMMDEVRKMKRGSIALTNQITTISKIRIYDPKTNYDILSNVKLSNEKLDLIDNEILQNFTGAK